MFMGVIISHNATGKFATSIKVAKKIEFLGLSDINNILEKIVADIL
jgi:hypothetical protein